LIAPLWADQLRSDLSQGDLISEVPHGAPAAADRFLERGPTLKGGIAQWLETSEWKPDGDNRGHFLALGRRPKVLVLSHDCEIDKKASLPVLVAPVLPIELLGAEQRQSVVDGRRYAFFYLAHLGESGSESYVDFRAMAFLPRKVLDEAHREQSMTDVAVEDLQYQLVAFLTRIPIDELRA
jgi:hypothetical protein